MLNFEILSKFLHLTQSSSDQRWKYDINGLIKKLMQFCLFENYVSLHLYLCCTQVNAKEYHIGTIFDTSKKFWHALLAQHFNKSCPLTFVFDLKVRFRLGNCFLHAAVARNTVITSNGNQQKWFRLCVHGTLLHWGPVSLQPSRLHHLTVLIFTNNNCI